RLASMPPLHFSSGLLIPAAQGWLMGGRHGHLGIAISKWLSNSPARSFAPCTGGLAARFHPAAMRALGRRHLRRFDFFFRAADFLGFRAGLRAFADFLARLFVAFFARLGRARFAGLLAARADFGATAGAGVGAGSGGAPGAFTGATVFPAS